MASAGKGESRAGGSICRQEAAAGAPSAFRASTHHGIAAGSSRICRIYRKGRVDRTVCPELPLRGRAVPAHPGAADLPAQPIAVEDDDDTVDHRRIPIVFPVPVFRLGGEFAGDRDLGGQPHPVMGVVVIVRRAAVDPVIRQDLAETLNGGSVIEQETICHDPSGVAVNNRCRPRVGQMTAAAGRSQDVRSNNGHWS